MASSRAGRKKATASAAYTAAATSKAMPSATVVVQQRCREPGEDRAGGEKRRGSAAQGASRGATGTRYRPRRTAARRRSRARRFPRCGAGASATCASACGALTSAATCSMRHHRIRTATTAAAGKDHRDESSADLLQAALEHERRRNEHRADQAEAGDDLRRPGERDRDPGARDRRRDDECDRLRKQVVQRRRREQGRVATCDTRTHCRECRSTWCRISASARGLFRPRARMRVRRTRHESPVRSSRGSPRGRRRRRRRAASRCRLRRRAPSRRAGPLTESSGPSRSCGPGPAPPREVGGGDGSGRGT